MKTYTVDIYSQTEVKGDEVTDVHNCWAPILFYFLTSVSWKVKQMHV